MEYIGYVLLAVAMLCWLGAMIVGLIMAFPFGVIGLIAILGIGILLASAIRDRLKNKEDDYYSTTVEK